MTPSTPPFVSIVILSHNDGEYLRRCLFSVCAFTRRPFELILIDNASTDGTQSVLRELGSLRLPVRLGPRGALPKRSAWLWGAGCRPESLKRIHVRLNPKNRFFAGGNNQGIRAARGEQIILLNADTWVGPLWLERLQRCARLHPEAGLLAPRTNHAAGWQLVRGLPRFETSGSFFRFALKWGRRYDEKSREVHRLTAFCLLIKRPVIERVGFLDERFGAGGYEDYDYCIRARRAGFAIRLVEDALVYHHGGRGYVGMDYEGLRARNREVLAEKYALKLDSYLASVTA